MGYLGSMTGKEVIRLAKEISGLTECQIAAGLGVSVSIVKRYLNRDDTYFPGLEMIPRLCAVLGNTNLLKWQEEQLGQEGTSCENDWRVVPLAAATIVRTLSPFTETAANAGRGRYEDLPEALDEVFVQCTRIRAALPSELLSLTKKKNGIVSCPLWPFWSKP